MELIFQEALHPFLFSNFLNDFIDNDSIYLLDSIEHTNDVQLWRLLCFTFGVVWQTFSSLVSY